MNAGPPRQTLRARVLLPVSQPPIENGGLLIEEGRIVSIGRFEDLNPGPGVPVTDLGEVVLMPGLINAHCHLDYTDMAAQVPATRWFTDWIKSITALKATWSYTEFAQSWLNGAHMLLRNGTTTVADIEAVPELLPDVWQDTPLRVLSFLEMTGVKSRRDPKAILEDAVRTIESLPTSRSGAGLSPHAPYSTTPDLLRMSGDLCRERGWRMTTHVAESPDEFEMFMSARGPMYDWLARNERSMADCGHGSPIQHLNRLHALGRHMLAVHVNCLAQGDAKLLAQTGTSVVHCPLSHTFFGHPQFPHDELLEAGVNICLGTDSLASTPRHHGHELELDMFAELQEFSGKHPGISPAGLIPLATTNAARALGHSGTLGELTPGARADCIAIPFAGKASQVEESVIQHSGAVAAVYIEGQRAEMLQPA